MLTALQAVPPSTSPIDVELIGDPSRFPVLSNEWSRLLAASNANGLFLTWEWLCTWWRHLSGDRKLTLLAVRMAGELVAIAPFSVCPRFHFGYPLETLEFLGSGFVGSDYLDIIARSGCEDAAIAALVGSLSRRSCALRFGNVLPDSLAARLAARLVGQQWTLKEVQLNVCPWIPLAGATWESFMAGLGAEQRYNFRRKWNRLNRDYDVRFDVAGNPAECRSAVDRLIHLHNLRWRGHGVSDAFHTPALVAFHREFAPLALQRGWLRIYTLWLNEQPAACLYGFVYDGKFYFYQSGFDPVFARNSVGMVTMGLAIRSAIDEGLREFDLLRGDEPYKSHWSRSYRRLMRYELFPSHTLGCISEKSLAIVRSACKMASSVLNTGR